MPNQDLNWAVLGTGIIANEMAAIALTMHSKQPKRAMISREKHRISVIPMKNGIFHFYRESSVFFRFLTRNSPTKRNIRFINILAIASAKGSSVIVPTAGI